MNSLSFPLVKAYNTQRQTVKKPHNLQTNIVFYLFFGAKNRIFRWRHILQNELFVLDSSKQKTLQKKRTLNPLEIVYQNFTITTKGLMLSGSVRVGSAVRAMHATNPLDVM